MVLNESGALPAPPCTKEKYQNLGEGQRKNVEEIMH